MKTLIFSIAITIVIAIFSYRLNHNENIGSNSYLVNNIRRITRADQRSTLPDYIAYGFFFNRIVSIQKRLAGLSNPITTNQIVHTSFDREAGLNDQQTLFLANVAFFCVNELKQVDTKAGQIILAYKSRFPSGKIPHGVSLPPPPIELNVLQQERNAITLRYRDRLLTTFGPETFKRLDEAVKNVNRKQHRKDTSSVQ